MSQNMQNEAMILALKQCEVEIVELILENGFNLTSFLTVKTLCQLFDEVCFIYFIVKICLL